MLVNQVGTKPTDNSTRWYPPVDLSHLTEDQRYKAEELLAEEGAAFSQDDNDMGCLDFSQTTVQRSQGVPL